MSLFRRLLGRSRAEPPSTSADAIPALLSQMKPRHAEYLSAYAAVLARVAYSDRDISPDEAEVMRRIIERVDEVSPQDARLIVGIASEQARRTGENQGREATRLLGLVATRAQRMGLMRCVLAVAAAHEGVSEAEFDEIEEIGRELGLNLEDLEACRLDLGGRPAFT